jgi:hypothetical protein
LILFVWEEQSEERTRLPPAQRWLCCVIAVVL